MEHLFTTESLISFLILTILEVVLGIDNVIFVSIIMNRMPKAFHKKARLIWMITGIISRTILLFGFFKQLLHNLITMGLAFTISTFCLTFLQTYEHYDA